jgi:hypothetical protein
MEWFDKDFFKALEMVGLAKANEDFKKMMNEPTSEELPCERLGKERDYWKALFEKEHEANKKLTDAINKLTDYLG